LGLARVSLVVDPPDEGWFAAPDAAAAVFMTIIKFNL
jgi:hypothetical protein